MIIIIIIIVGILYESSNPQIYWRVLKKRLINEGNETVTICNYLKLKALSENIDVVKMWGSAAKLARDNIEQNLEESIVMNLIN